MNKVTCFLFIFILSFFIKLSAQEVIMPLMYNPEQKRVSPAINQLKSAKSDSSYLFIDDFCYNKPSPDTSLWLPNSGVFVNTSFSKIPISIGMATFDALDNNGNLYSKDSSDHFKADSLVSKPLNLNFNASDSIYLRFYYQQGGLGDFPDAADKFVLSFKAPLQKNKWVTIKQFTPIKIYTDAEEPDFVRVMIPITDTAYLHNGFQFKFTNYASIKESIIGKSSNADIWNLDYVTIGKSMSYKDTVLKDLAIASPPKSFLLDYTQMPWAHYKLSSVYQTAAAPKTYLAVRNNNTSEMSGVNHIYSIRDMKGGINLDPFSNSLNLSPGKISIMEADNSPLVSEDQEDSAIFRINVSVITEKGDRKENDSWVYYQNFYNYYAYDDGSPEYGYGLVGEHINNGMVALKYNMYKEDSLQAVDIYFNQTLNNENVTKIKLCVWNVKNGLPELLYMQEDTVKTGFARYYLKTPLFMSKSYFIGWQQDTVSTYMNVGLDYNDSLPKNASIMYNTSGLESGWKTSAVRYSLMMRPIVGKRALAYSNIESKPVIKPLSISVYPNPASDIIHFGLKSLGTDTKTLRIFEITGKLVTVHSINDNYFNISNLKQGVYLFQLATKQGIVYHGKFVKCLK